MLSFVRRLRWPLLGATAAALITASFAGATHLGYIQIGHAHSGVNTPTGLNGSVNAALFSANNANGLNASAGLYGIHSATSGRAPGVRGVSFSTAVQASAVLGEMTSSASSYDSAAVRGVNSGYGHGVAGRTVGQNGFGGYFEHSGNSSVGAAGYGHGLRVDGPLEGMTGVGAYTSGANTRALQGYATGPQGVGVWAYGTQYAGLFAGNVYVDGTLSKAAGSFKIDHPLAPSTKYLSHSFVESPDMKNVYDGVVTTDRRGFATVRLPRYFQALNRSFRYQLTSLSGLQNVAVAQKINRSRFVIQSEKPNSEVSWQVTGIRKDAYANAHRIKVEESKAGKERGTYMHPELYRKPRSFSAVKPPALPKRPTR